MKDLTKQIQEQLDQLAYKIVSSDRNEQKKELLLNRLNEAKLQMWLIESLIKIEEEGK